MRFRTPSALACILVCVISLTGEAKLIKGPCLQWLTTDGVTIMWETDAAVPATVEYGPEGRWSGKIEVKQGKPVQTVRLTGLRPETAYQYRLLAGQDAAGPFVFRTAVKPDSSYRFAAYSDNHGNTGVHRALVEAVARHCPAFVLHAGDRVNWGDKYAEWGACFFEPLAKLSCSVPVFPCMGNHDGRGELHRAFFSPPEDRLHYSFVFANAKVVVIDSCSREAAWSAKDSPQGRWLARELKQGGYTWTLAVFHVPPYSSHPERGCNVACQKIICPLLEEGRVDLVFNGHNHCYERVYPMRDGRRDDAAGVPYIIMGGGGGALYPVLSDSFTAVCESVHHYCIVDVDGPMMTVVTYTMDGRVIDRFSLCKDANCLAKLADQAVSVGGTKRAEIIDRLSYVFSPKMTSILDRFIADPDVAVRRAVANGLGRLAMPSGRAAALKLLGDSDKEVRRGASLAVARASGDDQIEEIRGLLGDPDGGVRSNAAWFFIHHSNPRVVALVSAALDDSEVAVRRRAIRGLRNVHDESIVPALTKAVGDADGDVALMAINQAIRGKRTSVLAERLVVAARHRDPEVRVVAVRALASCGQPRVAVPALIERLADDDARTQGAALGSLEGMTGKRLGYDRQKWQKWWDEQLR